MKEPKLKKCIICQAGFKQFESTKKVCSLKCAIEHAKNVSKEVKLQEYSKALQRNRTTPTSKKISPKENLEKEVNKLARKIDAYFGYGCIDCGRGYGKQTDAAHFHNKKGNENIRYNLHNLHSARSECNRFDSEHKVGYRKGLIERYGEEYLQMVDTEIGLHYPYLGLNEIEIKESLKIVRKLNREFDNHTKGNDLDGAMMRSYFNEVIGIYK